MQCIKDRLELFDDYFLFHKKNVLKYVKKPIYRQTLLLIYNILIH